MRTGVLSDLAIKQHHPEFFPLDVGSSISEHDAHLPMHPMRGIKLPKDIKNKKTIPRFPINDLKNLASFSQPARKHQQQFRAIMDYRKKFESDNVPQHIEIAYKERLQGNYKPIPPKAPSAKQIEMGTQTASASIRLYKHSKHEGVSKFDTNNPEFRDLLTERSKATLYNMADPKHHPHLLNVLFPHEKSKRKISDSEFKHVLSTYYFDSPSEVETINKAYEMSTPHLDTRKIFPNEDEEFE